MGRLLRFLAWLAKWGPRIARRLSQLYDMLDAARIALKVLMEAANRARRLGQEERYGRFLRLAALEEQRIRDIERRISRLEQGFSEIP